MVNFFQRLWRHVTGETARQERAEMRQVLSWFSVNWKIGTLALATQGNDRFG
jgi:hypothetical protein